MLDVFILGQKRASPFLSPNRSMLDYCFVDSLFLFGTGGNKREDSRHQPLFTCLDYFVALKVKLTGEENQQTNVARETDS